MSGSTVLIVDDEQTLARSAKAFLADHGYEAEVAASGEKALELLERLQPDVVFADVRLPGMSGIDLLKRIREFDPVLPVIMLTAYGSIEGAVEAVKLGAFDYVKKPVDLEELTLLADRARENRLLKQELSYYRRRATRDVGFATMVGESPAVRAVLERARQIAALEDTPPVLLTGETGTGKGILAHAIHAAGPRASKPFIEVNCTTLPATLMEAELFGYERGAFTDAKESKPGLVEAAEGGFLFLDEIGDVDLSVQGKLLRAIEERTVRRVGSVRERKVDVRIVAAARARGGRAASHRPLPAGPQCQVREDGAGHQRAGARVVAVVSMARQRARAQPRDRARGLVEPRSDAGRGASLADEPRPWHGAGGGGRWRARIAAAGRRPRSMGKVDDRASDARGGRKPNQGRSAPRHLPGHAAVSP